MGFSIELIRTRSSWRAREELSPEFTVLCLKSMPCAKGSSLPFELTKPRNTGAPVKLRKPLRDSDRAHYQSDVRFNLDCIARREKQTRTRVRLLIRESHLAGRTPHRIQQVPCARALGRRHHECNRKPPLSSRMQLPTAMPVLRQGITPSSRYYRLRWMNRPRRSRI